MESRRNVLLLCHSSANLNYTDTNIIEYQYNRVPIYMHVVAIHVAIVATVGNKIPALCICGNDDGDYGGLYKRR